MGNNKRRNTTMNLKDIVIPSLGEDQDVVVSGEDFAFSLKNLINLIIDFINKLIKFEF